ncbi:RNA polymerase sigma factor FliA [Permianibacter aggregans]|uniref:RNA polymerase sigma factor FliA n=1 Tax=Permianibacter aggregans TaxID=1510150 RepID=A0A4R6UQT6_9GAMM|nr:RNA polymerase sigma factor FliA [Permianibacter aggregans]TDQ48576.1 RNA polymerase sigma-28 (SigD/FliA/WhiG) subunit [Permianibacter aggregans]
MYATMMYETNASTEQWLLEYTPLVKRIAHHLMARLPASVQVSDLIQAGMIGLLEASKKFEQGKGASFETFAGIRIRGAMLDEVRRNDWMPRSVHRNARRISQAVSAVEQRLGRAARDPEIASELGVTLDEYHQLLADSENIGVYGFDDIGLSADGSGLAEGSEIPGPERGFEKAAFQRGLAEAIEQLPERERLVLALYYEEELNLKEIGQVLGVSESRVCQICNQAMARLRSRLKDWN